MISGAITVSKINGNLKKIYITLMDFALESLTYVGDLKKFPISISRDIEFSLADKATMY